MPGYHLASQDRNIIDPKYFCVSCALLLREVVQTSCGHFYCQSCLPSLIRDETSDEMECLVDKNNFLPIETFADNFMRREVLALVVHCLFMEEGCAWRGEVKYLEDHKQNECQYLEVPCVHDACSKLVKKSELADHLVNECRFRPQKCHLCGEFVAHCEIKEHLRSKHSYLPHQVDNLGDEVDDLRRVVDRLPEEIQQLQIHVALQLRLDNQRRQLEFSRHEDLLLENNRKMEEVRRDVGNTNRQLDTTQESTRRHDRRIESIERTLALMNVTLADRQLDTTQESTRRHDRRIESIEQTLALRNVTLADRQLDTTQESTRRHERRIESIEQTLALRNVTLADLEEYINQQEFPSYDGQLLWRISDYARKRNDAVTGQQVSFYSPCFYTSRYGYKMCARIYLNGDEMGKGTHMSIFLVVMRGKYDALLRWPFRQEVTFMLLDQDNVQHVIDIFRPDPKSSSFQRPGRETNIASGCPMFCSLAELNNHAYVRDDTMFLKIIVDTSDLYYS